MGLRIKDEVLLTKSGCLRISRELLPENAGSNLKFIVKVNPDEQTLELTPTTNGHDTPGQIRKARFSNDNAKSPHISVVAALRMLGVKIPKKPTGYVANKRKDGTLVIKF